jgi:hypothetical protein
MDPWERFGELFDEMKPHIASSDWQGLERHYADMAMQMSGSEAHGAIHDIVLEDYEQALKETLDRAFVRLAETQGIAVYFEYDIDNDWQSYFFLYDHYLPESEGDDEWAVSWKQDIEGPDLPVFTELCETFGGFDVEDDAQIGVTLYLIARTTASFGRALEGLTVPDVAICMGYHDQGDLTRIREAPEPRTN